MGLGPLTVELLGLTRARARGVPNCWVANTVRTEAAHRHIFTLCALQGLLRFYDILDYTVGS